MSGVHQPLTLRRYLHYRKKDDLIVIKFGSKWCNPCKKLTPILETLANQYRNKKGIYFVDVDIDNKEIEEHLDLADIKTIPHIKIFVNGKMEKEIVGYNPDCLIKSVERMFELKARQIKEDNKADNKQLKQSKSKTNNLSEEDQRLNDELSEKTEDKESNKESSNNSDD